LLWPVQITAAQPVPSTSIIRYIKKCCERAIAGAPYGDPGAASSSSASKQLPVPQLLAATACNRTR
jgi:hypothetical protein